jgi:hypothetical protein
MPLKTLLFPCLGPVLFQMVGSWNGIRPRPTLRIPSDVVPGLSMTSVLTTCCNRRVCFPLLGTIALTVCNLFSRFETSYFIWKLLEYNSLWCKNVMVIVSLDSPSCEVTLFDPVYRWFIGMLPDRPRDYTVWSTLEPSEVDSRTWAGIIQVGSATPLVLHFQFPPLHWI